MPKIVNHQERRKLIAAATAKLISEKGLEYATIREVAKSIHVSRGLVVHYFTSKEDLIDTALNWANDAYLLRVSEALRGVEGLKALLIRLENILPINEQNRMEWRIRLQVWGRGAANPEFRKIQAERFLDARNYFMYDLKQAMVNGELNTTRSTEEVSKTLMAYIVGLCVTAIHDPEEYTPTKLKWAVNRYISSIGGLLSDLE